MSVSKIIDWYKTFQKERVSSPFHSDLVSQHWIDEKKIKMKRKWKWVCPNNNNNGVFVKLTGRELLCLRNDSTRSHGTYILGLFFLGWGGGGGGWGGGGVKTKQNKRSNPQDGLIFLSTTTTTTTWFQGG